MFAGVTQNIGFQDGLRQFLNIERHAVGLGNDVVDDFGRQRFGSGDAGDQRLGMGALEAV